ncbi:sensor histidine kinase [Herbidospora mongoliensis]|uniref:sensor histidine kinase n=1 Tax=Herbidospora mongoliensis TaxID=688067 RepID=UPI001C3F38B7|nr:sensor histidine kinase [Herbidospora mongoliensis]
MNGRAVAGLLVVAAFVLGVSTSLAMALVGLAATLPLVLLWSQRAAAGVLVTVATVLSLTAFQDPSYAGLIATMVALFRLGETSERLALACSIPCLALIVHAPVLALAPSAAMAGITWQARRKAQVSAAARDVIEENLLRRSAAGERARIARELHDVVAHHISMVAVQAEAARLATPGLPQAGADRLRAIGDTARSALTEMRRLLGVLREDTDQPERVPQPGLRELNALVDTARAASGGATRLILRGTPIALDPVAELAAYRIVQEALTNVRRHAPGAAVDVEFDYGGDALRVVVRDNGPAVETPIEGLGLVGMRERAYAVGGTLRTGALRGGGFMVEAILPGKTA